MATPKDALAPRLLIGHDSTFWKHHNASEPEEPCDEHLEIQFGVAILPNVLRLHVYTCVDGLTETRRDEHVQRTEYWDQQQHDESHSSCCHASCTMMLWQATWAWALHPPRSMLNLHHETLNISAFELSQQV